MTRRTHLSIELADGGLALAPFVAGCIAPYLGWSSDDIRRQLAAYRELIAAERAALGPGAAVPPAASPAAAPVPLAAAL
ncbi:hypothetical protein D9M70_651270 [compost metagenome]